MKPLFVVVTVVDGMTPSAMLISRGFFSARSFIASSYKNNFVISFSGRENRKLIPTFPLAGLTEICFLLLIV